MKQQELGMQGDTELQRAPSLSLVGNRRREAGRAFETEHCCPGKHGNGPCLAGSMGVACPDPAGVALEPSPPCPISREHGVLQAPAGRPPGPMPLMPPGLLEQRAQHKTGG